MIGHRHAERVARQAGEVAATHLTMSWHEHAAAHGWPHEVASKVSVVHRNGAFHMDWSGDDVHDLEYGKPGEPPSPAIRRFQSRLDDEASRLHETHVARLLGLR